MSRCFFAGAPIVTSGGHALGTLCVIDRVPRALTGEQKAILKSLGRVATALLELRGRLADRGALQP